MQIIACILNSLLCTIITCTLNITISTKQKPKKGVTDKPCLTFTAFTMATTLEAKQHITACRKRRTGGMSERSINSECPFLLQRFSARRQKLHSLQLPSKQQARYHTESMKMTPFSVKRQNYVGIVLTYIFCTFCVYVISWHIQNICNMLSVPPPPFSHYLYFYKKMFSHESKQNYQQKAITG